MFYFDEIDGKKILKSDLIKNANAFFTTRDICIYDKSTSSPLGGYQFEPARNELCEAVCRMAEGWGEGEIPKNKKILTDYLKIKPKNLISPTQTHSANVDIAKENKFDYPDTDGLILTKNNLAIFLNFADCTPLIFYDEKQNIGAISHAGWRGTAKKIAQITANKLINEFNSKPEDICVLIGPAICGKCYEVGIEVYHNFWDNPHPNPQLHFVTHTGSHNSFFVGSLCIPKGEGKFYIDLKEINRKQLADIGIEKVDVCPYCTCCDNEYFFSYRKENGTTLRHSAVLKLK